tara:strand:+ start:829 stop:1461 length:633 start_codon:yes stop_codon:yes gene_type:complete
MKKLLIPIIIILLALVAAFYFYSNQSVKISEYKGIVLGMSMDKVIYAFGEPEVYIEGKNILSNFPTKPSADEFKKNGSKGFNHWRYSGYKTQNLKLERLDLFFDSEKQLSQINCTNYAYEGLTVDFANTNNINVILRSARNSTDFNYESQISQINSTMNSEVESLFFIASDSYKSITSTLVRQVINLKGNYSKFVSKDVANYLKELSYEI